MEPSPLRGSRSSARRGSSYQPKLDEEGHGVSHQGPGGLLEGGSPLPGIHCCQDSFMSPENQVPVQADRRTRQQKVMVPRTFSIWKLTHPDSCPTSELLSSEMGQLVFPSLSPPPLLSLPSLPSSFDPPPASVLSLEWSTYQRYDPEREVPKEPGVQLRWQ